MPNFIAKNLKDKVYPFGHDGVQFLWEAQSKSERLIYTQNGDEKFFIVVKKTGDGKNFVIKGEKLTKPDRIGLLQQALCVYRDENTTDVVSQAFAVKNKQLTQKINTIVDIKEFLSQITNLREKYSKIFIEIGFGSGRHLLFQAQNHPDALFIGIEVYKPSIEQVAKLAHAKNLENIRVINTDARLLLSLIASNSVDKIFLHFPVPWEKAEHRRVISEAFALECERVLKVGGTFELRTDVREYCDFGLHHFLNLTMPKIKLFKNRDLAVSSKYEDRWKRENKDIYDMLYTCNITSDELSLNGNLDFDKSYYVSKIISNFKNETIKQSDYFLHFEEIFTIDETNALLKISFGAFNKPEQCFIKISPDSTEYFIKRPILTRENLKAHEKLKEYLAYAANY
ncbi:tRNA (guanosine(46)-N7)-methyltransferase TrmB [Campylobacter sp. faydin G-24]|uniref:tRNA (guanine-N(7)-)-methyltransferase n=1 Tax=Campylobacter anatolicus TaxID=2829105 RepID=A0ABS5HHG6_9BACT|nr:tRNA (guanosine(46)-N7)-methyltransferase TrmB [Campylobacter anatolicus]MBR8462536.1 tRNA (guanosine(46)-N7)-methyltransferase TrmB [Campylobacter anatolicus]MBR8463032.1 tRNA (guanosine(46)-N7)-methyltransferase TrmB [Campylobacter anatolicus]